MPDLRQLAIVAEAPERLAAFYQEVFELERITEEDGSRYLSDGTFNLALLPARKGMKPGFRYIGFEMARAESIKKKLEHFADSSRIVITAVADGDIDHEMRDPDGNLIGLNQRAFDTSFVKGPVPIRHIALFTPNPQRLRDFYCQIFGMKEVDRTDRSSIFVSDGYINLALLYQRKEEPLGLNHFGFQVTSNDELRRRAEKSGVGPGARRPDRIPFAEYRVRDPEGNGIDISEKGFRVDPKQGG
jgi:catechol 2,3-dioxygenase-like lactoylglutathione lyase family enzyme